MRSENQRGDIELFREYKGIRGMSLIGDALYKPRFAYLENLYIDHESPSGAIESIPGFRKILSTKEVLHSFCIHKEGEEIFFIYHAGNKLYRISYSGGKPEKVAEISDTDSVIFKLGGLVTIKDGEGLYSLRKGVISCLSKEEFILGCKSVSIFDDRLFLSGNKDFPGVIFYSSRLRDGQPVFSVDNRLYAGGDISYILAHRGRLWVFRSAEGEITYATCHDADEGYPVCLTLDDLTPLTEPLSTRDGLLLLTDRGLLEIEHIEENRASITLRSREINPMLLKENLSSAGLLRWKGYLAVGCGEHIYLADKAYDDYDWYLLTDIGGHTADDRVYRYSKRAAKGYDLHKSAGEAATGSVMSVKTEDGRTIYYSVEGEKRYTVYPTEERSGGVFLPAKGMDSDGDLLAFFCDGGIYLFNSDMRGVPPEEVRSREDFDEKEYARKYSDIIHPLFYSFDNHAPKYILATNYDDCDLPLVRKGSIGQSLSLRLTAAVPCTLNIKINTESDSKEGQKIKITPRDSYYSFESGFCYASAIERSHGWIEKQIVVEGEDFASPIKLSSLAFKYYLQEKLKKG